MSILKLVASEWCPPALFRWFRQVRNVGNRFEGDYDIWDEARVHCTGYDAKDILAKVLAATLKVKHGEAAFERDSVLFDQIEYAWPVLAGLMWAAARAGGSLNVLDFGGSLGSSYFQNRKFLQSLPDVRWNVVEQPHYVEAGQAHIQNEQLRFYNTVEVCLTENQPNVVLLSSVLQYLEEPSRLLADLITAGADFLIITRTPFSSLARDKLSIQSVSKNIYLSSYPSWIFSRDRFLTAMSDHWRVLEEFDCPEGTVRSDNGLEFNFRGFIFERVADA